MITTISDSIHHSPTLLCAPRVELELRLRELLLVIDILLLLTPTHILLLLAPAPLHALIGEKRPGQILLR